MVKTQMAREALAECGIPLGADSDLMSLRQAGDLLQYAAAWKYRRPRNANGSTARYFHDYLQRLAARGEK